MRTKRLLTISIALILSLSTSLIFAGPKQLLRLNLQQGEAYTMAMRMENNIQQSMMGQQNEMKQVMDMTMVMKVDELTGDGNFIVSYNYSSFKMDMDAMGQSMSYDSESPDESSPFHSVFKGITDARFQMELTPTGKIVDVKGIEEYLNTLTSGNQQLKNTLPMFTDDKAFKQTMESNFSYLPEEAVSKGDRWSNVISLPALMNMNMELEYELIDVEGKQAEIKLDAVLDMNQDIDQQGMTMNMSTKGTQQGTILVNTDDGMARENTMVQDLDMLMKMTNPQTGDPMEMPMKIVSEVSYKVTKK